MRFVGHVFSRSSSTSNNGVPGETEIQALNPTRRMTILALTCWPDLAPGSLNLRVDSSVLTDLSRVTPLWVEDCRNVVYPHGHEHILRKRIAYYYYLAEAALPSNIQEVLVRKAWDPVPNVVELLAPVSLKPKFMLEDGDPIDVEVGESNYALNFWRMVARHVSCVKQQGRRMLSAIKLSR